jgi:glucosamine--fructose-6-phosphate aminotransferase (isomerizing)
MGAHLCGGDLQATRAELEALAPALDRYLAGWREHVRSLAAQLDGVRDVFIVGRGRSLAAAGLGGMIQKEAAHVHGEGMGSAAFRHGPIEMLGPDSFVLVLEGDAHVRELNLGLLRDIAATGARAALCGPSGEGPFALPEAPESVRPVLEQLPPQMISLALAGLRGREPGRFERITKVTAVE